MLKKPTARAKPFASSHAFNPPYPPSWFDRLTAWVDRLPGPPWAFYLILGIGVSVAGSIIQWIEGAYPAGTFNALHVWTLGNFAYVLALMHYLDRSAASAITTFRPILAPAQPAGHPSVEDEATFDILSYQLTTLPPRQTLVATVPLAAFAIVTYILQTSSGVVPSYLAGTAGTMISTVSVLLLLIIQNAVSGVLAYHTIHQLVLISRIYTQQARINIYQLQPLYALSIPGAFTAIGIILYVYIWFATATSMSQAVGPVEIALIVLFAAIAGATFALPLLGAHRRLVAEKNRRLAEVDFHFEAAAERVHRELVGSRLSQIDTLNKAMASLELERAVLRRIPTWPWEPGPVRGLVAALLLPIAVWLLQLLLGRLLGA
jgi:hypothetical protein